MKRVMVDQGSAAEIMYPDLFKGLNLRTEDLTPYTSPLVSFEGKIIIPKGQTMAWQCMIAAIRHKPEAGSEVQKEEL